MAKRLATNSSLNLTTNEKVALAMLDGFADPSASVITAIGIVTNVIVLSVIFFFQYQKNRSPISVSRSTSRDGKSQQQLQLHELPPLQQQQQQQQNQPQPHQELLRQQYSNQSTRSVEPRRKWASAYIHLLFLAVSDLSVNVICFGGAIWRWCLFFDDGALTAFPRIEATTSPPLTTLTQTSSPSLSSPSLSSPSLSSPSPPLSSFVNRFLVWYSALIIFLNINRLLHVFIMFLRARALVSAVAASEALAKSAVDIVVEVVVFLLVYFVCNVILVFAVFFAYLW